MADLSLLARGLASRKVFIGVRQDRLPTTFDSQSVLGPRLLRSSPLELHAHLPGLDGRGISLPARFPRGQAGCDNRLLFLLKRLQRPPTLFERGGYRQRPVRRRRNRRTSLGGPLR